MKNSSSNNSSIDNGVTIFCDDYDDDCYSNSDSNYSIHHKPNRHFKYAKQFNDVKYCDMNTPVGYLDKDTMDNLNHNTSNDIVSSTPPACTCNSGCLTLLRNEDKDTNFT